MSVEHVYKLEIHCIEQIIEDFTDKGVIKAIKEICRKCKHENIPANQLKIYEDTRLGLEYYAEDTLDIRGIATAVIAHYDKEIKSTTNNSIIHGNKYLKEIASESGAYSDNELQINGDTVYYSEKLEVFVRVDQHHNVIVSKNVASYSYLETYADIYRMLTDLDFGSNLINEVFLTANIDKSPLYFIERFVNDFRKELNQHIMQFTTQVNIDFLKELKITPNLISFRTVVDRLHKAITTAQGIATVKFIVTDDDTACFYKDTYGDAKEKSIKINLLMDYPAEEMKVF